MKKLLLILIALPMIGFGQQTVGLFSNLPESYNGYTLFNSFGSTNTYLIDNCGTKVYEWNSNYSPAASVYLLENGNLLRTNQLPITTFSFGGTGGGIEILDPSSNVIWSYEVNSDSTLAHHDLEILPNGNILILAIELISAQEADTCGSLVSIDRYSEMIIEVNPSTSQIVWEWHAWDHLIQDTDSNLLCYGTISEHPKRININYAYDGTDPDWLHANSIDYNADLDQIIINIPTFNELWIIDHSTTTAEAADSVGGFSGKGGDILYRWGNPQAYNRGDTLDQVFEFQHDAHWIPSGLPDQGKIMIFNNGNQRGYSSIDIIEPPLDTNNSNNYILTNNSTPYGPLNLYWSYSDSINFYSPFISGAQQLENGNILICSGAQGSIFEIEYQTDSVVWDYIIPMIGPNPIAQGDTVPPMGNICFRAQRFSPSYSGFDSLALTPTTVIELNPLPSTCQIYISGCTDSLACNYDPLSNINDGSCNYNSTSYDTLVSAISINWNSLVLNNSGDYSVTLINSVGCDSIANINFILNVTGTHDIASSKVRTLIRITDMLGKEAQYRRNTPLFYIYDDGTVEKKVVIE